MIDIGSRAPAIPGASIGDGPRLVVFYKVTCPVCQMAAPKVAAFERAYPGRVIAVGQDPAEKLEGFAGEFGMVEVPSIADLEPYDVSNAYGVEVVPTFVLLDSEGVVADTLVAWDRDAVNRLSEGLASLSGSQPVSISDAGDGLPPFRPG